MHHLAQGGRDRTVTLDVLVDVLLEFPVSRIHVHHLLGFSFDFRQIIDALGVPFDFTVHDYSVLCPRINMVTALTGVYCAEADQFTCNRCISMRPAPLSGTRNIFAHSWRYQWLLTEADRVICPSEDVASRLRRYGFSERLIVVPHETLPAVSPKPVRRLTGSDLLCVAILGNLAPHKGLATVRNTVLASQRHRIRFVLIGSSDPMIDLPASAKYHETGEYTDPDLLAHIDETNPDVIWFPAVWPETYSYTLSAALTSGRPIVASDCGAFSERMKGVPWTWLLSPFANPKEILEMISQIEATIRSSSSQKHTVEYAAE